MVGDGWLVASGVICWFALALDPTFARGDLLGAARAGRGLRATLVRSLAVGVALTLATRIAAPAWLFHFPRTRTMVWLAVMFLYPVSALAQEIVFRTFFFHRYGTLFSGARRRVLASGLAFGWAHVVVNNLVAVGLASLAGMVFASTYQRSRSTLLVSIEHALYGDFLFSVGLGSLFYSTTRWLGG